MPGEENGGDGVCKRSLSWSVASLPGSETETYVFRSSYVAFLTVQTFAREKARLKGRGRPDGARGRQSQNRMFVFQSGSLEGKADTWDIVFPA